MLILTRKRGERIYINDDIVITLIKTEGDRVFLGFEAPEEHQIWREEIYYDRIEDK